MTSYSLTPTEHHVYNEFDRFGLLLGLNRIESERNATYKQRLLDVMVHRANSTHQGLIYGITRELGLELYEAIRITPKKSGSNFIGTMPIVVFSETKCLLYSDYNEGTVAASLDRFAYDDGAFTIQELVDAINETAYFTAEVVTGVDAELRSMTIFNQESIHTVPYESIAGLGVVISLANRNLISSSIAVGSAILKNRVSSSLLMVQAGDYYVDCQAGILYTTVAPAPGDAIRYQYIDEVFSVWASPVIIHNLQSADFKTKMYEQIADGDGNTIDGLPTNLGADIINELISAYPISWGR